MFRSTLSFIVMPSVGLSKIFEDKVKLKSIPIQIMYIINTDAIETTKCTSSISLEFSLFIVLLFLFDYYKILCYLFTLPGFGSCLIQNSLFSIIHKSLSLFLNFSIVSTENRQITGKQIKNKSKTKGPKNKFPLVLKILFPLIIISNSKMINLLQQHIKVVIHLTTFYNNIKKSPIVPQLYNNGIVFGIGLECENETIVQERSYSQMNISISHCFFSRSSLYSGYGGVIYVVGSSYSMDANYSMFYNCSCSSWGGAIYFNSYYSCLRMICANSCSCGASTAYGGHFAYSEASWVNQVEYLSVLNCSPTTSGYYSIHLQSGDQRLFNTNSSMNNAQRYSGITIYAPSSFTGSYCTFSNNKVSNGVCIEFYSISGTISISYTNIVHNNSPTQYGVVFVSGPGSRKMMFCIFQNNQNYLFCVYAGSLEVSHSFIYHSASLSTSIAVSPTTNNSFTNSLTFQIQFFHSHHCNADIPLIKSTPMNTLEKSPMRSNEETPYRSYAECNFSHQMVNKREISAIFSFSVLFFQSLIIE